MRKLTASVHRLGISPRWGGALLVLLAAAASTGRFLSFALLAGSVLWLLCLPRASRAGAVLVFGVALLLRLPFFLGEFHSNDLHRYVWEGTIHWEGFSPYATAPSDPELAYLRDSRYAGIPHPDLPTPYPPLAQMLFAGATGLGLEELGVRNLVLALDLGVVLVLLGWLRATRRPVGGAILYAWSPVVVASAAGGHIDPLMLLFLAGGGWAWERGRVRTAAGLLAGAILAKTVAILLVPWLLLRRPLATLGVLVPLVALGYAPYLGEGSPLGALPTFGSEFAFNASWFRVAEWISPEAASGVVAAILLGWVAWVTFTQPRIASAYALTLAGLLLLSPTVHYWYLTWFLVALPVIGPRRWTIPLVAWCVTILFSAGTYLAWAAGEPGPETFVATALEYGIPFLLAAWLLWSRWPRPEPLATTEGRVQGRVAVIVPCHREAENLRELLPRWLERGVERVIVADLPSADGTPDLCAALPRVRYLPVAARGYGAAVSEALAAARDVEFAVVCDADHLRGPRQLERLLAPFEDPRVALVTGARMNSGVLTPPQRWGNRLLTWLIAFGWGRCFRDLGPFRALRVDSWPQGALEDRGFGWNVEMNVQALQRGTVVEVELPAGQRVHGRNRISGTLKGVVAAGVGMLQRLYRLREASCAQPS